MDLLAYITIITDHTFIRGEVCECDDYCFNVKLMTSQVSRCDHAAVQLQFFETVVRYEKFFGSEPQFLPDVLVGGCCISFTYEQFYLQFSVLASIYCVEFEQLLKRTIFIVSFIHIFYYFLLLDIFCRGYDIK